MTKRAVVVGLDDYPGTGNDLTCCVADANWYAAEFDRRGAQVDLKLDSSATKGAIFDALRRGVKDTAADDLLLIARSSHGSYTTDLSGDEPDGLDECWVPYDFRDGLETDDEVSEILAPIKGRCVVFSDTCHAGSVTRFAPDAEPAIDRRVRFMPPEQMGLGWIRSIVATASSEGINVPIGFSMHRGRSRPPGSKARNPNVLLVAACQDWEYAYEGVGSGAFTAALRASLGDYKPGMTYGDLMAGIRVRLPSRQYPQTPRLLGSRAARQWKVE